MSAPKPSYDELSALVDQLLAEVRQLREENRRLASRVVELEDEVRAAHRQVAPFRRRDALKKPTAEKKKPGRPPGHPGAHRAAPTEWDADVVEPLRRCPHCAGRVTNVLERIQFIEECPIIKPVRTRLTTHTGWCAQCGDVESLHPLQTSRATGAAGTHLGPRAQALAVSLVHQSGLSLRKACDTLWQTCGLQLSPGGLAQLLQRVGHRCRGWYDKLITSLRRSRAVYADETSWYVGRPGWWLWVFTNPTATAFVVEQSRGADVVQRLLGDRFRGMLITDCLASYNAINCRKHKCIAHHLRVLKELQQSVERRGSSSPYLLLWKILLKEVIETWGRRDDLGPAGFTKTVVRITRGVQRLLERSPPEPEDVRFRDRLIRQRLHLLGCLSEPAAEPTNNRAERDLRPAVISRKISCGNRTVSGKTAWEILRSFAVTTQHRQERLLDALAPKIMLIQPGR
jgi:transposase